MADAAQTQLEPLMTAREVAGALHISESMVYKLRRLGQLPGVPVGALWRWDPDVVRAFRRGQLPDSPGAPVVPLAGRRRRV